MNRQWGVVRVKGQQQRPGLCVFKDDLVAETESMMNPLKLVCSVCEVSFDQTNEEKPSVTT